MARRRGRLRTLLSSLQEAMVSRYGYVEQGYRLAQVRKTCEVLGVQPGLLRYADAAFADRQELMRDLSQRLSADEATAEIERLQDELAAANGGDYRFVPRKPTEGGSWDNGSNVDAASRWGPGLW